MDPGPGWWAPAAAQAPHEEGPALVPRPPTVTLLSPEPGGLVSAGPLWLAVRLQAPAGVRGVTFWWEDPDGHRQTLLPEVAGPSEQEGTAWFEVPEAGQGTYRLTVQVEDGAGQTTRQSWPIQVVGELALEAELAGLEAGLWVRRPSAQQAVDQMAQNGTLWTLVNTRYGWRSGTDPVRPGEGWESTILRLTQPLLMRALVEDLPTGFLARGVRAYEGVRGTAYWWDVRRYDDPDGPAGTGGETLGQTRSQVFYGPQAYDPVREVAGWPAYLAAYRRHPAADDAAYRLGRSHELLAARFAEGGSPERVRYLLAAAWAYLAALELPDGDMAWDARNRLLYLIDAIATEADLEAMAARLGEEARAEAGLVGTLVRPALGADLGLAVEYALALRSLRAGRYEEAARSLTATLASLPDEGPWDPLALRTAQTRAAVEHQAAMAEALVQLQQQQAAGSATEAVEAAYGEAALIYREPFLFHLALWHGERARYLAFGHVFTAAAREPDRTILAQDAARQITYVRALALFNQFLAADPPEPWRERALFSKGMSLYHLLHYGTEVQAWRSPEALTAELVETFQAFAARYPASSLADDALLMVGVYGEAPEVLRELVQRYPDGDKRSVAEELLKGTPAGPLGF